ncbi:MAG: hypothetical protein JO058_02380 [Alphaproteobacteria bacterium]|nr:hypothetical protein [Alphaproteobacteria bacterium]
MLLINVTLDVLLSPIVTDAPPVLLMAPPLPDVVLFPEKVALPNTANAAFASSIAPPFCAVLPVKVAVDPALPIVKTPFKLGNPMAPPLPVAMLFENVALPVIGMEVPEATLLPEIAPPLLLLPPVIVIL